MNDAQPISRPVAAEDLRPGEYVAILRTVNEWMPLFCDGEAWKERTEPRRMLWLPDDDQLDPMKIVSICLPFVLVTKADGKHRTIDARQVRLARLPKSFGKAAFARLGPERREIDGKKKRKK